MQLSDYATRYETIRFERSDQGVLEMTIHTRGGEALWSATERSLHSELGRAFADIARDEDNKVVILTGTGPNFCVSADTTDQPSETTIAGMWQRFYEERVALLENLLAIPVPVISAVNGPAFIHAEVAVLSDIVLAAKHAEFGAARRSNATPNSGVQAVWLMLLGPNRGRYFLLSNERINADEAKRLGLVGEVLPADQLMARARILAGQLAQLSVRQLRHTRRIMVRHIRRRLRDELEFSVAAEALVRMD